MAAVEGVRHRTVEVNGVRLHVAEAGPEGGGAPTVLLLHGFPDLWYGWRHQMAALAARGYRAVAPDLRGYGDSDAPPDASAYTTFHVVGDLVALIADLGQPQEPGVAEAEFARYDIKYVFNKTFGMRKPAALILPKDKSFFDSLDSDGTCPPWLSEEDISYYAEKYAKTGFTGGFNYYRCMDLNWELSAPWTGVPIKVPTKFIVGDLDLTYNNPGIPDYIHKGGFKASVPNLEEVVVMEGVSHFINQEKPNEVSDHICEFFSKF
ncbi:unnamed protein product [Urochloa humidicola]